LGRDTEGTENPDRHNDMVTTGLGILGPLGPVPPKSTRDGMRWL